MDLVLHLGLVSAAAATLSMTLAKSRIALPIHFLASNVTPNWMQYLLQCPYCLVHWFTFGILVFDLDQPILIGTFIEQWLACVAFGTLIIGCMLRLLFVHESERMQLASQLNDAHERITELEAAIVAKATEPTAKSSE